MKQLNTDVIFAIANTLLEKAEAIRRPDAGTNDDRSTADIARDLIVWSREAQRLMERDSSRFAPPAEMRGFTLSEAHLNANDEINCIGDWYSFEMGFDLAVKITARITLDPLDSHDISDILDEAQATYLRCLRYQRDEYANHYWQARLERERVTEAREVDLVGSRI